MIATILETSFQCAITQRVLLPRQYGLNTSMLLYGGPKSGKSSLALSLGRAFKRPVYIDFQDVRFNSLMHEHLLAFCQQGKVDLLILKHPPPSLPIPNISTLITSSTPKNAPRGFVCQPILPLNFSEFVAFAKKDSRAPLARFLKEGNLPEIMFLPPYQKTLRKQEIYTLAFGAQFGLFKALLPFQARSISVHHLYTQIKKHLRISKDTLYAFITLLQESFILFFIPSNTKAPHKLYFYDFAMPYAFSYTHPLPPVFENMVVLELIRHFGMHNLCYQNACLLVQSHAHSFVCLPWAFPTLESLERNLRTLLKGVSSSSLVFIVSINCEHAGKTSSGHTYQAHSFSHFCLHILPTL